MEYMNLLNIAADIARKHIEAGIPVNNDDTICVICSASGNVYTGTSNVQNINGIPTLVHAEIDAINNMKSNRETKITTFAILNIYNMSPILPCNGCINLILSIDPDNINSVIALSNCVVRITDVNSFISSAANQNNIPQSRSISVHVNQALKSQQVSTYTNNYSVQSRTLSSYNNNPYNQSRQASVYNNNNPYNQSRQVSAYNNNNPYNQYNNPYNQNNPQMPSYNNNNPYNQNNQQRSLNFSDLFSGNTSQSIQGPPNQSNEDKKASQLFGTK